MRFTRLPGTAAWPIIPIFHLTGDGCWWLRWTVVASLCLAELLLSRAVATCESSVPPAALVFRVLGPLTANGCTSMPGRVTNSISGASVFRTESPSR